VRCFPFLFILAYAEPPHWGAETARCEASMLCLSTVLWEGRGYLLPPLSLPMVISSFTHHTQPALISLSSIILMLPDLAPNLGDF
jgi:hypothetical protein